MLRWLLVFSLCFALDFVYSRWTQAITEEQPYRATGWAALCYTLTGLSTVQYVGDPWLLIPAVLGCMGGTFCAVKFKRKGEGS